VLTNDYHSAGGKSATSSCDASYIPAAFDLPSRQIEQLRRSGTRQISLDAT
jgi:hypothetical protein